MKKRPSSKAILEKRNSKYEQYRDEKENREKPKNFFLTALRLLKLLKGKEIKVTLVVVLGVFAAALSVIGPQYLGSIMDLINVQIENKLTNGFMDFGEIYKILITVLVIYALSSVCQFFLHFIMADVTQGLITDIREKINRKLTKLPLSFFDKSEKGDLLSRVTNDIDNINNSFQNCFIHTVNAVVTFVGVFIVMFRYNALMSAVSIAPLPVGALIALCVLKSSRKYFRRHWEVTGDINGHIEEMFTGHSIVKIFSHEKKAIEEFREINDNLYEVGRRAQFLSGILSPLISCANNLGYVFICVIGGYLIINGTLGVGTITVFMVYTKMFMQPLVDMSNIVNQLQSSLASAERVFEILDQEEESETENPQEIENPKGEVSFENVSFSYTKDKPLIENFSLCVKSGELVAIVGPTGAGKTTIVNLLMRFYDVNEGSIKVDGKDIRNISRESLHNIFGMVLQDTWLFKGTVRENIMYGQKNVSQKDFENAVKIARVDSFINLLPNGYDTVLEDEGGNLSEGQRQLITIARAVLRNPAVLLLDEATSSVDTRTEKQIQEAMSDLMKGRTNFVIAHRLSTVKDADNIIFIKDGSITEQGNHEKLLEKKGDYANLYYSQFSTAQ